jgi:hypothetical protein
MATDRTEPPIKRIIGITLISVGTLVGLRFAFQSYYLQNYEARQQEVIYGVTADTLVTAQREARAKLNGIGPAMDTAASSNRPSAIAPTGAPDTAARVGWGLLPTGYTPPAAPPPAPAAAAPVAPAAVVPAAAPALPGAAPAPAPAAPAAPAAAAPAAPAAPAAAAPAAPAAAAPAAPAAAVLAPAAAPAH